MGQRLVGVVVLVGHWGIFTWQVLGNPKLIAKEK